MTAPKLTPAQERILREAERVCLYEPRGSRIAACARLRAAGLMRLVTYRVYRVTAAGRWWIALADAGGRP